MSACVHRALASSPSHRTIYLAEDGACVVPNGDQGAGPLDGHAPTIASRRCSLSHRNNRRCMDKSMHGSPYPSVTQPMLFHHRHTLMQPPPPPSWTPSRSPNRPASCRHHLMARCGGLDPAATWRPASHHRSGFFHYAWRPTTTTPHRLCHRHHPGLPRSRLCLHHHWGSQRNRVGSRSSLLVGCPTREGEDPAATILATTRFPMARSGGREGEGGGKEAGGVVAA